MIHIFGELNERTRHTFSEVKCNIPIILRETSKNEVVEEAHNNDSVIRPPTGNFLHRKRVLSREQIKKRK